MSIGWMATGRSADRARRAYARLRRELALSGQVDGAVANSLGLSVKLWLRRHANRAHRFEREAEHFAYALPVDVAEASAQVLVGSWEVAQHLGVPDERVGQHGSGTVA